MPTITREEYLKGVKADLHNMEKQSDDPMVVQQSQARAWLVNTAAIALIGDPAKTDKDDVLNTDHLVAVKTEIARHSTKLIESYYNFCVKGEYTEGADVTKVSDMLPL